MTSIAATSPATDSRRQIQWIGISIGVLWFGVWVLQLFVPASEAINPFVLSYVTGLVLGTAYAGAERHFARHGGTA